VLNYPAFDITQQVVEQLNKVLPTVVVPPDGVPVAQMPGAVPVAQGQSTPGQPSSGQPSPGQPAAPATSSGTAPAPAATPTVAAPPAPPPAPPAPPASTEKAAPSQKKHP
jgi:hypothetical protein